MQMSSNLELPAHQTKQPDSVRAQIGGVSVGQGGTHSIAQVSFQSHTGPLPAASELAAYDKIKPDLVERILCMAEANAESERQQAEREQKNFFTLNITGRILGFLFALSSLAATVWLAINGHDKVAIAIGVAAVGGTVAALITGRINKANPK
ncbi:hypothetical protein Amal_01731 [Acetobacter malorum]|uniref:Uncharacterized protein n=1 Tax=Acetobacter malorum TaxID=178901 RepID=A0A177G843_9PROT|nr:hypothetical protein Amal_01731 [Acetobacter malorum]